MIAYLRHIVGPVAALLIYSGSADAQQVIATVAPSKISVSSNYSGGSIVVFGAIAKGQPSRSYDAVVTVTGPPQNLIVRRKERVLGIWVNRSTRSFENVPSFAAVFANRPFDAITKPDMLRQQRLGLKYNVFPDKAVNDDDPFEQNLISARIEEGLYLEQPQGVSFVSLALFRTEIPLPKNALTGNYDVDLKIFASGALVAQTKSHFNVEKIGVAQFVAKASVDYSLAYGLTTMAMALLTGWLGSIAFRRS